jgi:hypothetical protein
MPNLKPPLELRNGFKNPKRLAAIHELPCVACWLKGLKQKYPTEAHHKIGCGLGKKASDNLTMALCDLHHLGRFIRDEDAHLINGWSIHKTPLHRWEEEWKDQDFLIELTNRILKYEK